MGRTAAAASAFLVARVGETLARSGDDVDAVVRMLAKAPQTFVYGVGRSGIVGRAFAMRLTQLGRQVFFIGETNTPIVERGDVVIIISYTGATMSAIQTATIARRVGAKVVVLTGRPKSRLAKAAHRVLWLRMTRHREEPRLAPLGTLFEDAALLFLDGLVAELMERLGETERSMRRRHAIMV